MPLQGLPSIRQKHIFSQTHIDKWVGKGKTARGSPVVPRSPLQQKQPAASKPGLSADVWALVKENTTWPQEEASAPQHRDFPGDLMLFVYPATAEGQSHLGGFAFFLIFDPAGPRCPSVSVLPWFWFQHQSSRCGARVAPLCSWHLAVLLKLLLWWPSANVSSCVSLGTGCSQEGKGYCWRTKSSIVLSTLSCRNQVFQGAIKTNWKNYVFLLIWVKCRST